MGRPLVSHRGIQLIARLRAGRYREARFEKNLLQLLHGDPVSVAARLFGPGYHLQRKGEHAAAVAHYREVVDILERVSDDYPRLLTGTLLARISLAHGARLIKLRQFRAALPPLKSSVQFCENGATDCVSSEVFHVMASSLGWLALAQRFTGQHAEAKTSYDRAIGLWRQLSLFAKSGEVRLACQRALAATLYGAARNLRSLGLTQQSDERRSESTTLFRKLRVAKL
ncbi:MAG: tetratricopeptide repeat protein [Bdellovibrionota bacterium]